MITKNFFKSLMVKGKFKGILSDIYDFLGEVPFIQEKLASVLKGVELMEHLRQDNELADFFAGRINISQVTILHIIREAVEEVPEVEVDSFIIEESYMWFTLDVNKGPVKFKTSIKLSNLNVILEQERQLVNIDITEFPRVIPESRVLKPLSYIIMFIVRKLVSRQYIYRRLTKDIEGLSVNENTFSLDLMQVPMAREVISRKILGINIIEFIGVERVEMRQGFIRIYGGPRIPARLIN